MSRHLSRRSFLTWFLAAGIVPAVLGLVNGAAAGAAQRQVTGLTARHQSGQTMLAWQEVYSPATDSAIAAIKLREIRRDLDKSKKVRYRIYRAEQTITSLQGMRPIAEVPPLSGWNIDYYGDLRPEHQALRYVVEEGKGPVPPGTGIYAHNPKKAGTAYYAVTVSIDGKENTALGQGNVLVAPTAPRGAVRRLMSLRAPVGCVTFAHSGGAVVAAADRQAFVIDVDGGVPFAIWRTAAPVASCARGPFEDRFSFVDVDGSAWVKALDLTGVSESYVPPDPAMRSVTPTLAAWTGLPHGLGR